jgi:hypothetical protein
VRAGIGKVHEMPSVLAADEVGRQFGEVTTVENANVEYGARNATMRHDELPLESVDTKVPLHKRKPQAASESQGKKACGAESEHKPENKPEHRRAEAPTTDATGSASPPESAAPIRATGPPTAGTRRLRSQICAERAPSPAAATPNA